MNHQLFNEVPRYVFISSSNDARGLLISGILAFLTLVAVIVALFQEPIRSWFDKAILEMKINLSSPDCTKILLTDQQGNPTSQSIYIRIRVNHIRGNSARNCEIMVSNFWRVGESGALKEHKGFLPMNLVWSHFNPRLMNLDIRRNLFHHCDLGFLAPFGQGNKTILKLDTITQPNPINNGNFPNILPAGKYVFELLLSGDNVDILRQRWELEFSEKWSDNEQVMLQNRISIRELTHD